MMSRNRMVAQVTAFVLRGRSVDIVGDRGAGRTQFLADLHADLAERGWESVRFHGNSSFRAVPFAGLSVGGMSSARDVRLTALASAVDELSNALTPGRSAILIDDWHELDEASRGVVSAAHTRTRAPVVLTRTRDLASRATPTGFSGANPARSLCVTLAPMPFDEFDAAIAHHVGGGRFEPSAMSQLFSLSAGHIGLGVAVYEAAVVERKLELIEDEWVANGNLWCDSLSHLVEGFLEPLSGALVEALELLAVVGAADLDSLRQLICDDTFEQLEAQGLITLIPTGSGLHVTVSPPLIVEYFRSTARPMRRMRLLGKIDELHQPLDQPATSPWQTHTHSRQHGAQFVRLVRERLHTRQIHARSEWNRNSNLATGVRYVEASIRMPLADTVVDRIFEETSGAEGDEESKAHWAALAAEHRSFHHNELAEAVSDLRSLATELPRYGGLLQATAVELEFLLGTDPNVDALPDPDDEQLPDAVRIRTHQVLAQIRTSKGDIARSNAHLDASALLGSDDDPIEGVLRGTNLLLEGNLGEAYRLAVRGFEEGRAQHDPARMRGYGHLLCVYAMLSGRYGESYDVIGEIRALGDPVSVPPFVDRDLAVIGSVVAARRGQHDTANRLLEEAERAGLPNNPMPALSLGWAYAQLLAGNGSLAAAADRLMIDGDTAWDRGASATAALSYLAALEVDPCEARLEACRPRINKVGAPLIDHHLRYIDALIAKDPLQLLDAAESIERLGLLNLALAAFRQAATLLDELGDVPRAEQVSARALKLQARVTSQGIEAARFVTAQDVLTDREAQVARLAAAGRTNAQIASELVLSPRTVESHLYKAMRKAGVQRRAELGVYLGRVDRLRG